MEQIIVFHGREVEGDGAYPANFCIFDPHFRS